MDKGQIDHLFHRYRVLSARLPRRLRWLALVLAPWGTSLLVVLGGLVSLAGATTITVGVSAVARGGITGTLALVVVLALLVESSGYILKERQEMWLTILVRQLTYRRFQRLPAGAEVLTFPAQISQFAYVVDFALSVLTTVVFVGVALYLYGLSGMGAALVISGLAWVSVRLVRAIGRLWEGYVAFEGERRRWIHRAADALPRGVWLVNWHQCLGSIHRVRGSEEDLLRRRVRLQVVNGFVDQAGLTAALSVVAIVGGVLWPGSVFGVGLVLAGRYLAGAIQNNIANYRVIRLAVPMLRALDALEQDTPAQPVPAPTGLELVHSDAPRAEQVRTSPACFLSAMVTISHTALISWRETAGAERLWRAAHHCAAMGLSDAVQARFWQHPETLSTGERMRAVLALILAEEPSWLVFDDALSVLDPATRELVAHHVARHVGGLTVLFSSTEYLPLRWDGVDVQVRGGGVNCVAPAEDIIPEPPHDLCTWLGAVRLLFGSRVLLVALGALVLCLTETLFVLTIARAGQLTLAVAVAGAACVVGTIVGSGLYFRVVYHTPIARLGALHRSVVDRLGAYASARTRGAVVGRLGEDFSDLQMSAPSALGGLVLVVMKTVVVVAVTSAQTPVFVVVVAAVVPVAWWVMRRSTGRITPAAARVAKARGEFLGTLSVEGTAQSPGLRAANHAAYQHVEHQYLGASRRLMDAYTLRTIVVQLLVVSLQGVAVVLALVWAGDEAVVPPVAVIYFASVVAAGVQAAIAQLHEVAVIGLTAGRVRALATLTTPRTRPTPPSVAMAALRRHLAAGDRLIAIIGATGSGKSVLVDELLAETSHKDAALITSVDPFAEQPRGSALTLLRQELAEGKNRLLVLDETLRELTPAQERQQLHHLAATGMRAIVVLHSRENLDLFDAVIDMDQGSR